MASERKTNTMAEGSKEGVVMAASKLAGQEKEKGGKVWNTANLGSRLAFDAACAATAGGLVAPLITIVDK